MEFIRTVAYALFLALLIRTFLFQPFNIPTGSMKSTLLIGDYIFVSKYSYGYSRFSLPFSPELFAGRIFDSVPERGDVVVFKYPPNTSEDYIKRLIGLPGDRIQMIDGVLQVNDEPVGLTRVSDYVEINTYGNLQHIARYQEELPNGVRHDVLDIGMKRGDNTPLFTVPEGMYFMMGDNRDNSSDSRSSVGFVPHENLVGKAQVIFFSTDHSARFWEFWRWPAAVRWSRLFENID